MDAQPSSLGSRPRFWAILSLVLILATAALRLLYLAFDCPLDLSPDEAHYWDWSRRLDWSYYSKGPLVAWLIRLSCELFGNNMLAVRLPAVVCGSLLLLSLYVLTLQVYSRPKLACGVVAAALTLPLISAGSSLMTIDAPYTCCWGWALVLGHRAIFRGSWWAWPLAGLVVGLGILAKYTMVLWLGSLGLFLLFSPEYRRLLFRPGVWIMGSIAALCCLPILVWNLEHDWISFRHVQGLAGLAGLGGQAGKSDLQWTGPLLYVGAQAGLLLVFWFIAWLAALVAHRPTVERDAGIRYLWWFSVPTFAVFLLFSVKTGGGEANWPVPAYLSGLVLTAAWLSRQLESPSAWYRRWTLANLGLASAVGLLLAVLLHKSDWAFPVFQWFTGPATAADPTPLRKLDPSCRLRGWQTLANEVDRCVAQLRARGIEPIVAGTGWSWPGELAFYCDGQPVVYCLGPALGDRRSQYDLWRPNPIADGDAFRGRTFVLVGPVMPALREVFDCLEQPRLVTHFLSDEPIACWTIVVGHGYRGVRHGHELRRY